ncbi:MAG: hypothetical protein M0C28_13715 [Candidatus Moduliflexus flocculans]|nr:hypothetical protein [Candidatus Moduliflexus flocculans]
MDGAALSQALTNLLDNAVKYSGDSRIDICPRFPRGRGHRRRGARFRHRHQEGGHRRGSSNGSSGPATS